MNWTIFTICCSFLAACVLLFIGGIGIGMSMKSKNEKQDVLNKFVKWLEKQKEKEQ